MIFRLFCYILRSKQFCRNYVGPGTKREKMSHNVSRGQKWAHFEKEYLSSDCTSDTTFWMIGDTGRDISVRKDILTFSNF